jgi:hypothetical protein
LQPLLGQDDLVAQLVEQYTFNVWALGSSPSGITKKEKGQETALFCSNCPGGEIGRHAILRGWFRKVCWFESSPGHKGEFSPFFMP